MSWLPGDAQALILLCLLLLFLRLFREQPVYRRLVVGKRCYASDHDFRGNLRAVWIGVGKEERGSVGHACSLSFRHIPADFLGLASAV